MIRKVKWPNTQGVGANRGGRAWRRTGDVAIDESVGAIGREHGIEVVIIYHPGNVAMYQIY